MFPKKSPAAGGHEARGVYPPEGGCQNNENYFATSHLWVTSISHFCTSEYITIDATNDITISVAIIVAAAIIIVTMNICLIAKIVK